MLGFFQKTPDKNHLTEQTQNINLNVQSIINKINEFKVICCCQNPNNLYFTEHWLPNDMMTHVPGYKLAARFNRK